MRHGVQCTYADVSIALHARAARVHGSVHWFGVVLTRSGSSVGVDGSEDTTGNVRVYAAVRLCGCSIVRAGVWLVKPMGIINYINPARLMSTLIIIQP